MVSTKEQRRRYRKKYPEKVKEQRKKYLEKKLIKRIEDNPNYEIKLERKFISDFNRLTRLKFNNILPKYCMICNSRDNLQIHHIQYKYPIIEKDLKRLCQKCHKEEHQRIIPIYPPIK